MDFENARLAVVPGHRTLHQDAAAKVDAYEAAALRCHDAYAADRRAAETHQDPSARAFWLRCAESSKRSRDTYLRLAAQVVILGE